MVHVQIVYESTILDCVMRDGREGDVWREEKRELERKRERGGGRVSVCEREREREGGRESGGGGSEGGRVGIPYETTKWGLIQFNRMPGILFWACSVPLSCLPCPRPN